MLDAGCGLGQALGLLREHGLEAVGIDLAERFLRVARRSGLPVVTADLARLPFLAAALREQISQVDGTPILSDTFEASVPNLYFLGLSAANSFGPLLRFMYGAEFAAPRLSSHLNRRVAAAAGQKRAA